MADERIEIEKELRDVRNELDKVLDVSAVRPITTKHMENVYSDPIGCCRKRMTWISKQVA